MLIFYSIKYLKNIRFFKFFITPFNLIFIGNLFVLLLSIVWVTHFTLSTVNNESRASLNDRSNYERFLSDITWTDKLISNDDLYSTIEIDEEHTVPPHNSLIRLLCDNGIVPGFLYLLFLSLILRKYTINNEEYLAMYMFYSYFLHGLYSSVSLILFFIILHIENSGNKTEKRNWK